MNPLLSKSSLRILESLSFTDTLYAFDFDGTLAPIVENPEEAYMARSTEELLIRLAKVVPTAIISGRSLLDLKPRVPASIGYLIGNHGLEGLPHTTPVAEAWLLSKLWRDALTESLIAPEADPGIILEDKKYSLAIHYRKSRQKKLARNRIIAALATLQPEPRIIPGKFVFNAVPAQGPHKGVALSRLMQHHEGTKFAFYIGDDDTDEDVFTLNDSRMLTVSVGNRKQSRAKYFIHEQPEIDLLLKHLLSFYER
jgi:trehalose 6-phosphate phosphatase